MQRVLKPTKNCNTSYAKIPVMIAHLMLPFHLQGYYGRDMEAKTAACMHTTEETVAQSMCQSLAMTKFIEGRVYAVGRRCTGGINCIQICSNTQLHQQDSQTSGHKWITAGAFHVYKDRPITNPEGTPTTAKLGLKSLWRINYETYTNCGPNYCCCVALLP